MRYTVRSLHKEGSRQVSELSVVSESKTMCPWPRTTASVECKFITEAAFAEQNTPGGTRLVNHTQSTVYCSSVLYTYIHVAMPGWFIVFQVGVFVLIFPDWAGVIKETAYLKPSPVGRAGTGTLPGNQFGKLNRTHSVV